MVSTGQAGKPMAKRHVYRMASGEVVCLLILVYSTMITFTPIQIARLAGHSSWVAKGLSGLFAAVIILVWVRLLTYYPDRNLPQLTEQVLGKVLGRALNGLFFVYFVFGVSVHVRIVCEVIWNIMPETPLAFFIASALIVMAIIVRLGPEVMGRMATVVMIPLVIGTLGVVFSLSRFVHLHGFLPIFAEGVGPVLLATITPTSFLAEVGLLGLFAANLARPSWPNSLEDPFKKRLVIAMTALVIAWWLSMVLTLLEQAVLGAEQVARLAFPALKLVRAISIGMFFERVEVSLVAVWLPAALLKIGVFLYGAALFAKHLLGSKAYRHYVVPVAAVSFPGAYTLAANLPKLIFVLNGTWSVITLVILALIPAFLLLVAWRKQAGRNVGQGVGQGRDHGAG